MTKEDKKLQRQSLQKNLDNAELEIKSISGAKEEQLKRKDLLLEQIELRKKMHELAQRKGGFENLQPTWAFQKDPEYQELQRKFSDNEFKVKSFELDNILTQMNNNLKTYDEQIESQTKNAEETRKKLKELGE